MQEKGNVTSTPGPRPPKKKFPNITMSYILSQKSIIKDREDNESRLSDSNTECNISDLSFNTSLEELSEAEGEGEAISEKKQSMAKGVEGRLATC